MYSWEGPAKLQVGDTVKVLEKPTDLCPTTIEKAFEYGWTGTVRKIGHNDDYVTVDWSLNGSDRGSSVGTKASRLTKINTSPTLRLGDTVKVKEAWPTMALTLSTAHLFNWTGVVTSAADSAWPVIQWYDDFGNPYHHPMATARGRLEIATPKPAKEATVTEFNVGDRVTVNKVWVGMDPRLRTAYNYKYPGIVRYVSPDNGPSVEFFDSSGSSQFAMRVGKTVLTKEATVKESTNDSAPRQKTRREKLIEAEEDRLTQNQEALRRLNNEIARLEKSRDAKQTEIDESAEILSDLRGKW